MAVNISGHGYLQGESLRPAGRTAARTAQRVAPAGADSSSTDAIASLAHDLRTPLAALHMTVDLLDEFATLSHEEIADLLHRLRRGVAWMTGLVDNFATWSALEEGRLSLRRAPVTMLECVESAVEMVRPVLERRGQRVRITCPEPAPVLYVDPMRLGQVLVNLLTNASAYSGYDEVITVTVTMSFGDIRVAVADNGPGIPLDEQRNLFGRGNRGATGAGCRPDGQGLGLHIVETLVRLHDGEVGLDSIPGEGASFWFTLPYPSSTTMETAVA